MARIGIESELPVVDGRGNAAAYPSVRAVFEHLAVVHGFEPYHDPRSGTILGARRAQGGGTLDVGTDYGFCTLEVALPPADGFEAAQREWQDCLDRVVLPALASQQLGVLGYGCQPRTETVGRAYIADKGHYELWTARVERYPSHYASDAWPGFAALQFNVDVATREVVRSCNTLIRLSPLIMAWGANSPVFGGRVQPWLSLRVKGYTALAGRNPFFAHRLFFPRRLFGSLADYMREAWSLPLFEVSRQGAVYHPAAEGLSTLDFAAAGRADFLDLGGEPATLTCTSHDLATGLVFYWPAVRVKMQLDERLSVTDILAAVREDRAEAVLRHGGRGTFVEIRHLPSMSRPESFAWLAMLLAWLEDIGACAALVEGWTLPEVEACTEAVLTQGWSARMHGRPLTAWAAGALEVATRSLERAGVAPAEALGPLRRRLEDRTSPATDAVECFRRRGIDALVAELRLG